MTKGGSKFGYITKQSTLGTGFPIAWEVKSGNALSACTSIFGVVSDSPVIKH